MLVNVGAQGRKGKDKARQGGSPTGQVGEGRVEGKGLGNKPEGAGSTCPTGRAGKNTR